MKKLSIGSWAYIFNQEKPTTDFHEVLHKLSHLGYDGVELGSFGPHPSPVSHPTRASRQKLKKVGVLEFIVPLGKVEGLARANLPGYVADRVRQALVKLAGDAYTVSSPEQMGQASKGGRVEAILRRWIARASSKCSPRPTPRPSCPAWAAWPAPTAW